MKKQCRYCNYCKNTGRSQSQQRRIGRKHYSCVHPKVSEIPLKDFGNAMPGFIGFGDAKSYDSPIMIKTAPRWCPIQRFGE